MKTTVNEHGELVLVIKEVYGNFLMETSEGNQIAVLMRDDTFEINVVPKGHHKPNWWRINMQKGTIEKEKPYTITQKPSYANGEPMTDDEPQTPHG